MQNSTIKIIAFCDIDACWITNFRYWFHGFNKIWTVFSSQPSQIFQYFVARGCLPPGPIFSEQGLRNKLFHGELLTAIYVLLATNEQIHFLGDLKILCFSPVRSKLTCSTQSESSKLPSHSSCTGLEYSTSIPLNWKGSIVPPVEAFRCLPFARNFFSDNKSFLFANFYWRWTSTASINSLGKINYTLHLQLNRKN